MIKRLLKSWNPALYQGPSTNANRDYFEGWYYKLVDHRQIDRLAVIPGIRLSRNKSNSHSFIQILDGNSHSSFNFRYPVSDFKVNRSKFELQIADNSFSLNEIDLNIDAESAAFKGRLTFEKSIPWPRSLQSPNSMGWYAYMPFMECYHSVLSMNHSVYGTISCNDRSMDFADGKGYLEKDWGRSFPSSYLWIQTNHFENENDASIFVSIATIPWLSKSFRGFIIGLLLRGTLHRFATYTGAAIRELMTDGSEFSFIVSDKNHELHINGSKKSSALLAAPYESDMATRIAESLNSRIEITFNQHIPGGSKTLYIGSANPAAVEIQGNIDELMC
ncbi:hypothetical protein JXB12_02560 [candidate division KSB1 bacterium]|nr:hypothetical protein [candidate division KSB1 bacterium]